MLGYNTDLHNQVTLLSYIIKQNKIVYEVITKLSRAGLKDYYIGAGCIMQTVWNYQTGKDLCSGISDIDLVYFDGSDLSYEAENREIERIMSLLNPCGIKLDIKNQARVHLWYKERFGYDVPPYSSVENAINSWPSTASSIGVRLENDVLKIYAPFGLNDLFGMIIRANKSQVSEEAFNQKADKWSAKWPYLKVIPW